MAVQTAETERERLSHALHMMRRRRRVVQTRAEQRGVPDHGVLAQLVYVSVQADLCRVRTQIAASQMQRERQIAELGGDGVEARVAGLQVRTVTSQELDTVLPWQQV